MEKAKALTPRQQAFVQAYIVSLNATQAAKEAGYSEKTAKSQGQRLLTNVDVADGITKAMKERANENKLDADRVLNELMRIAFFDIGQAFNPDGTMKPLHEMDEGTRRAIIGLEVVAIENNGAQIGTLKKVKFADKKSALDTLAKHLGLLVERVKVSGDAVNPIHLLVQSVQGSMLRPNHGRSITPTTIDADDFKPRN
jgi:phage terminase small subunit